MIIILRFILLIAMVVAIFLIVQYFLNPNRKLEKALKYNKTILLDDKKSVYRNFLLTYQGVLFEGEKHMGAVNTAFQINQIHMWPRDKQALVGLDESDFRKIENIIHSVYPYAVISWRNPVNDVLQKP